ncbi:MAG TPA: LytTR family DNA-binding domain-containing protein [Clostridia bacterium]|nr:LytTR family DNA-binding domain-containing protein [Clostridia bacterium]
MNIIICDDESGDVYVVRNLLESFFEKLNMDVIYHVFSDGEELVTSSVPCDIAFIDIEMPRVNGLEATRHIMKKNENAIVFIVTSYNCYLDNAMDLQVFRYISKPINEERFFNNLEKALDKYLSQTQTILLEDDDEIYKVYTKDIIYITIEKRSTLVVTTQREYLSNAKLDYWSNNLNPDVFVQPHYSYIVNLRHVVDFSKNEVAMKINKNVFKVPVSQRKHSSFKRSLYAYVGGGE